MRSLCLECGADNVGFVEIERPALAGERPHIEASLAGTRSLISVVMRMNREPIRTPTRSVANLEFHHTGDQVNEVSRRIVSKLQERGIRALNPAMGFPMEMDKYPNRTWIIEHKTVAQEAGMGVMGIHRLVIHPRFGNFILLGTVLVDAVIDQAAAPLDFNPCLECKLCVAACPVGAVKTDGRFDFSACYDHNYHEFMGGFTNWVEGVAESKSAEDYRRRNTDSESASMWQSLSFGANYKAAYCMGACPAGEDVITPFLEDRGGFKRQVVDPMRTKLEPVYAARGSDTAAHVRKRFPHKERRLITSGLRPTDLDSFLTAIPHVFQPGRAGDLSARYHFSFTGSSEREVTIVIRDGQLECLQGHQGEADLRVRADTDTWIAFLRKERSLVRALITRKLRLSGPPRPLAAFGRCFN